MEASIAQVAFILLAAAAVFVFVRSAQNDQRRTSCSAMCALVPVTSQRAPSSGRGSDAGDAGDPNEPPLPPGELRPLPTGGYSFSPASRYNMIESPTAGQIQAFVAYLRSIGVDIRVVLPWP